MIGHCPAMFVRVPIRLSLIAVLAGLYLAPARAQLLSSCTLTLSIDGRLALGATGTTLASDNSGGQAATLLMVGVNLVPSVYFGAGTVTGPTGWNATPTTYISVDSVGGIHQAYTSSNFVVRPSLLADTLTINSRVVSPVGFKAGSYQSSTTVTCQAS